jgi:hypothetical protein
MTTSLNVAQPSIEVEPTQATMLRAVHRRDERCRSAQRAAGPDAEDDRLFEAKVALDLRRRLLGNPEGAARRGGIGRNDRAAAQAKPVL